MSSILKALKKLEEEKARQEQGKVDIATDILRSSGRQPGRGLGWPLLVVSLLLTGAAAGVYFSQPAWMSSERVDSPEPPVAVQKSSPAAPSPPVQPPVSTRAPEVRTDPTPEPQASTEVVDDQAAQSTPETTSVATRPEGVREESLPPIDVQSRPQLLVSGIVYQDDPQNRMAVINDLPVMSGTTIEGAEVVDILPDRVVFDFAGEQFSVGVSDQP